MLVIPALEGGDRRILSKSPLANLGYMRTYLKKIKWNKIYKCSYWEACFYPLGSSGAPTKKPLLGDHLALSFKKKKKIYSRQVLQSTQKKIQQNCYNIMKKCEALLTQVLSKVNRKLGSFPEIQVGTTVSTIVSRGISVQVQFCPHSLTASFIFFFFICYSDMWRKSAQLFNFQAYENTFSKILIYLFLTEQQYSLPV